MMNKKWQRITAAVIAILLALAMLLSLVVPAGASEDVPSDEEESFSEETEASEEEEAPESEAAGEAVAGDCLRIPDDAVILNGVSIGGIDVSGMHREEAAAAVSAQAEELENATLTIRAGGESLSAPVRDLGFTWVNEDVADEAVSEGNVGNILERYKSRKQVAHSGKSYLIERSFNDETVSSMVEELADEVYTPSKPYGLTFNDNYELTVTEGADGFRILTKESINNLLLYLDTGWVSGDPTLEMITDKIDPSGDKEALSQIHDLLGSAETDYSSSSSARAQNIHNGVELISGTIVYPGDSFSMLDKVVPFSEENGYALAPSYAEGSVVDTYGGGICQVSTTLYMALLRAELQVDMRCAHSMIVNYVVPAMDAAISQEGGKDLQFTNNLDHPIYIYGSAWDGTLFIGIYGVETRSEERSVSFRSETLKETPIGTAIVGDLSKPMGEVSISSSGHTGLDARLWKDVTVNGETTSTDFNYSEYAMSPLTYVVGCKTSSQAALDAVESAIATNNINRVYQVLNDYGY